jgi:hypothetical protein
MTHTDTPYDKLTHEDCIDGGEHSGTVEYRMPLSGTGESFPRCAGHWNDRLDLEDRLRRDYPDSPNPPGWFDPMAAGEHWDEDY